MRSRVCAEPMPHRLHLFSGPVAKPHGHATRGRRWLARAYLSIEFYFASPSAPLAKSYECGWRCLLPSPPQWLPLWPSAVQTFVTMLDGVARRLLLFARFFLEFCRTSRAANARPRPHEAQTRTGCSGRLGRTSTESGPGRARRTSRGRTWARLRRSSRLPWRDPARTL